MDKKKSNMPVSWKIIIALVVGIVIGGLTVQAAHGKDVYVDGHFRQDGSYVQPHHRSAPDRNPYNNYGAQGNSNPYTGQQGAVQPQPYYTQPAPTYPTYNNRGNSSIQPYGR